MPQEPDERASRYGSKTKPCKNPPSRLIKQVRLRRSRLVWSATSIVDTFNLTIEDQMVRSEPAIQPAPVLYTLYGRFTSNCLQEISIGRDYPDQCLICKGIRDDDGCSADRQNNAEIGEAKGWREEWRAFDLVHIKADVYRLARNDL